ncbi:MAG: hypothetical protein IAE89_12350 [Anaerolineae bacterium]|nr:hypothetical protein [Anaerolineae bacterium]
MFGPRNTTVSANSIRLSAGDKKVLVLSHWSSYRPVFLTRQPELKKQGLIYFITPADIETFHDLAHQLSSFINAQYPNFGKHLASLPAGENTAALGEALARDLNDLNIPVVLFLDNLNPEAVTDSSDGWNALIQHIGDAVKIGFSSQLLPYPLMQQWISDDTAVQFDIERHRGELTFPKNGKSKPQLEVRGFGPGTALIDGLEVTQWEGMLPRTLFFYLIDNPIASRDNIFRDFWPQPRIAVKDATDIFHVTKHKVSEVLNRRLGTPNAIELTAYKQGVYIPGERLVRHYDVALFTDLLQQAARDEAQRKVLLEGAVSLYKGPFLSALEAQWVIRRRRELEIMYSEALIALGRINSEYHDYGAAIQQFREALKYQPEREDLHRCIISLLAQSGDAAEAGKQLLQLIRTVYKPLEMDLTPETRQLIEKYGLTDQ